MNGQLVKLIVRYVNHKRRLSQTGNYIASVHFQRSLQRCVDMIKGTTGQCQFMNDGRIKALILMNRSHLEAILPHPKNPSYQSQRMALDEIFNLAKKYV